MTRDRASIFSADADLDLQSFKPKAKQPRPTDNAAVKMVSEAHNFPSRQAAEAAAPPRRRRTGRNVQINIKARADTIDKLYAISDREGWVLGETLDHALEALDRALKARDS